MTKAILEELQALHRTQPDGLLRASAVVDHARDPATALHRCFEWDDTRAADKYRLNQARQLLRVAVTILPSLEEPYRAFVSLTSDRGNRAGGGYRAIADVLGDVDRRERFVEQAREDVVRLQAKYRVLVALVPRFAAALEDMLASLAPASESERQVGDAPLA
jgi:hypothetical protein